MTYADVVNQMQSIQSMLGLLQTKSTTASSATSSTNAASFASALDSATSAADTTTTAAATTSTAATDATTVSTATTASTDGTLISPNGTTGNDVVDAALDYQGTPYVLGGESKSGIDCSGLVQASFSKLGITIPRTVTGQETVGQKVDSLKDAKPGDLIVLNGGDHIAIYMGNNTVIHAPYAGRTVSVQKDWFTDKDITTIRRIVPSTSDDSTTSATSAASTTGTSGTTASSGLSADTILQATAMLTTYGSDVGLYSSDSSDSSSSGSSSGGTSLSSLLASFGLTGTSSTSSSTSSTSTSAAQQIIAARQALLGASS
jgi:cell wall-associated NlpC family hydrolase